MSPQEYSFSRDNAVNKVTNVTISVDEYETLLQAAEDADDLKLVLERIDEPNLTPEEFKLAKG